MTRGAGGRGPASRLRAGGFRTRAVRPPHVRDPGAVLWPAPPGAPHVSGPAPHAAVVGGGIAGLAAATALAERGVRVDVLERRPTLGGRLRGWPTLLADGTPATMSRGFHAFFRQYYNLRSLLGRSDGGTRAGTGTGGMLVPLDDYPLRRAGGAYDSFRKVPRTPPWNLLGFVARSPTFTLTGMAGMSPRAALPLLDVRVPDVYRRLDGVSAVEFLDRVRFPAPARDLAFEVFSRSFFADPAELSAAELVLMFHIYFLGSAEGLLFDVPSEPFPTALWDPLARRLDKLGVGIRTGVAVRSVRPEPGTETGAGSGARYGGGFTLSLAEHADTRHEVGDDARHDPRHDTRDDSPDGLEVRRYDAVVLALDSRGLQSLVEESPHLGDERWRAGVARLRQAPPFLVSRYWLDRPVAPGRPGFLGTSGYGPLDNVSVLDRWEGEAARWARHRSGSVLELHAYAVPEDRDRAAVEASLRSELARVYPETASAGVVDVRHEWQRDCPLFPVGGYRDRPGVRTRHPRLVVAGDLVRTALPSALMERAATTGFQAANALLSTWGVRGHPLWSVPVAGRSAVLRALARLG